MLHTEQELASTLELPQGVELRRRVVIGSGVAASYQLSTPPGRSANAVLTALRLLGLEGSTSHDKRIPRPYMFGRSADRLALLRGIMDADGHVTKGGHVEITLANRGLIDDVADLVRSLGGTARVHHKITTWAHLGAHKSGEAWRLSIVLDVCPFRWKAPRWRPRAKYPPTRFVESIAPDGRAECVCIAVAAPDSLYVTAGYVVTHNTVMFGTLAAEMGVDTLILAHRDELIRQAVDKLLMIWPSAPVGVVKAAENHVHAPVVVASVQTLARQRRLDQMAHRRFGLVIVDEAHHAAAASYRRVLGAVGAGPDGDDWPHADRPLLVGVTATPDRGDGIGLDAVFDCVAAEHDLLWGIRAGYLSDVRGIRVVLDFNLDDAKVRHGDYVDGELGQMLDEAQAPFYAAEAYVEHAEDRKALVFWPTVALAEQGAAEFTRRGIAAAWLSGETEHRERQRILAALGTGEIAVVHNCGVLTEGFDEPTLGCVMIGRPTRSRGLYVQMVGRGTRRAPGKADCLVIDLVGMSAAHELVTVPDLFGLPLERLRDGATSVADAVGEWQQEADQHRERARLVAEEVDLWASQFREQKLAWIKSGASWLLVTEGGFIALEPTGGGAWATRAKAKDQRIRTLIDGVDLETAMGVGEDHVRRYAMRRAVRAALAAQRQGPVSSDDVDAAVRDRSVRVDLKRATALVAADAPWRKRAPSAKQLGYAKRLGVDVSKCKTAGAVADAIDEHKARKALADR